MSRLKTLSSKTSKRATADDLTLVEALNRISDPSLASSLSVFYADLARAQLDDDAEGVQYARNAIAEAMRGIPAGEIDRPLLPIRRKPVKQRR